MLLAALTLLVVGFAAVSLWLWQAHRLRRRSWLASASLVAWVVGVGVKVHIDRSPASSASRVAALPSIAWPSQTSPNAPAAPPAVSPPANAGSAPMQVGSVDSLIGGLEKRLAEHPDDAAGWALLAQSYAFMGDAAAADAAVRKAAALGVDEAALRARVDGATRSTAPR